jgi:long-chain acyl-CoA synthetase
MPSSSPLSKHAIERIVLDILGEELSLSRGRSALDLGAAGWTKDIRIDDGGLELDSLERLNASAALNEFFHLHEYGAEDYLLAMKSVGEWCELVEQSLAATGTFLTFRTSGSTGEPKRCTHKIADLRAEVESWLAILGAQDQFVSLVPSHHIYGTIFTALLPDRYDVPCVQRRFSAATALKEIGGGKAVVVGTPTIWAYVSRSLLSFSPGLTGISSTAPLSAQLAQQLKGQRLERAIEVYGSSETAGIGWRDDPWAAYCLLAHWSRANDGSLIASGDTGTRAELMDLIDWHDDRHLTISGRRDGAVQIGGYNVFPERVRAQLLAHADVADAAVRLEPRTGRLKAFIVPEAAGVNDNDLIDRLDAWCALQFSGVERPRRFAVGGSLPRNAMGKLTDW